ncbi:hypothetical protein B0H14DRAFT_3425750 [Mycena olivaceomarginata]|nr:hypothetical protein B0H14DRAFT_3425750 [Mycena olivaceomarginata]
MSPRQGHATGKRVVYCTLELWGVVVLPAGSGGSDLPGPQLGALVIRLRLIRTVRDGARRTFKIELELELAVADALRPAPEAVLGALPLAFEITEGGEHESTRPQMRKHKAADIDDSVPESSSVGDSGIKQAISALESYRLHNQRRYKEDPEALVNLHSDPRVNAFESAAAHREPERAKMSHSLKTKGSSAGECSCEMLLTPTSVAFRGDSSRALLWITDKYPVYGSTRPFLFHRKTRPFPSVDPSATGTRGW